MLMYYSPNQLRFVNNRCNFIRCIELVLCITSSVLALKRFLHEQKLFFVFVSILLTSASFSIITFIDVFSRYAFGLNIQFKLWIMYTFAAGPMFMVCSMLYGIYLNIEETYTTILLISLALASATFFWDGVCIVFFSRAKIEPESNDHVEVAVIKDQPRSTDKTCYIGCIHAAEPIEFPTSPHVTQLHHHSRKQKKKPASTSYGGTFHVSKDAVPLPSPVDDGISSGDFCSCKREDTHSMKCEVTEQIQIDEKKNDDIITLEEYLYPPAYK